MKRAETWKHFRKLCFSIYWKASCKILLSDPVYHNAGSGNIQSKWWSESKGFAHCCPVIPKLAVGDRVWVPQLEQHSVGGAGLSPRWSALPSLKKKRVSFLGGARCRDTQRLQTFISSCGFVNLGLFLYLCTALPDKNTVLRREPACGCGCSWRGLLRDHRRAGAGTCGMFACVWVVQTSPYPPWTNCNSRFS